jgi:putative ubiquitin-RnfH superfamily antitoxin RatB of RatAB toxin-antitoxin module
VTGQATQPDIRVEVVLAMPDQQELVVLEVPSGTTVAQAIGISSLADRFEGFEPDLSKVGIFGHKVSPNQVLRPGDRIEIYRPLIADPKEIRRQRALTQTKS